MEQLIVLDRLRGLNSSVQNYRDLSTLKYGSIAFYDPSYEPGKTFSDSSVIDTKNTKHLNIAFGSKNWDSDSAATIDVDLSSLRVTKTIGELGTKAEIYAFNPNETDTFDTECNLRFKIFNRKTILSTDADTYLVSQYSKDGQFDMRKITLELQTKVYGGNEETESNKWAQNYDTAGTITVRKFIEQKAGLEINGDEKAVHIRGTKEGEQWCASIIVTGPNNKVLYHKLYAPEVKDSVGDVYYMFNLYKRCAGNKGFTETDELGRDLYAGYIKTIEDAKREWFSSDKTITYSILHLRYKSHRNSAKTRDEGIWQTVHIAYPTDKEGSFNWNWPNNLFRNFMQ